MSAPSVTTTRSSKVGWSVGPPRRRALDRASAEPPLRYEYGVKTLTLDDYLARNPITGLLIARGDTILVERYQYARNDRHRFASFSMAKTVTAMLIGVAIAEGHIRSVDDLAAAYVPALADTGVRAHVAPPPAADVLRCPVLREVFRAGMMWRGSSSRRFSRKARAGSRPVKPYNERGWPSGTILSYASVETQVLGLVLRGAVGRPVADYLHEKIWGADGGGGGRDLARRPLGPGGDLLLSQRGAA